MVCGPNVREKLPIFTQCITKCSSMTFSRCKHRKILYFIPSSYALLSFLRHICKINSKLTDKFLRKSTVYTMDYERRAKYKTMSDSLKIKTMAESFYNGSTGWLRSTTKCKVARWLHATVYIKEEPGHGLPSKCVSPIVIHY
jgi:hypothetical protein